MNSSADPTSENRPDNSFGAIPEVWTVQKVLAWSTGWLKEKSKDDVASQTPRLDVELILAHVLDCDRMRIYLELDRPLGKDERDRFKALLRRRAEGEPIAYIVGYRDFYRHRFTVNPSVLIPRADTEILVEQSLNLIAQVAAPTILDVGTGSGCIALSLALARPDAVVTGWDISEAALVVARLNKETLACENIRFECRDVKTDAFLHQQFSLIVSNPPYIMRSEEVSLSVSVKGFEPHVALFDDDVDGLSFYRILAQRAKEWLLPGGVLAVECGHTQAHQIADIFTQSSKEFIELTITKDLGGLQRVVSVRKTL